MASAILVFRGRKDIRRKFAGHVPDSIFNLFVDDLFHNCQVCDGLFQISARRADDIVDNWVVGHMGAAP